MSDNPDRFGDDGQRTAADADAAVPTDDDLSIEELQASVGAVRDEVGKRIIGQHDVVERLLVCVLCDGNALLESNPGLGKTTLVRALSDATDLGFSRVQNTPDLMPSDITGTEIIRETPEGRDFVFERGPIFANVVLADEINRATPKTQAALLEAMQEKQVTAAGETYELPDPFFVLATQNPIDQGGTYPLPEAQTDRFLMKILVGYPEFDEERTIVKQYAEGGESPEVERVLPRTHLLAAQQLVRQVPISDDIRDRTIELVRSTREDEQVEFGASPRASMALVLAAKARAFVHGRTHVSWEDVVEMAPPVIRHRIILDFRAEREGLDPDDVIQRLLNE
ncbi:MULTISPECIES: MoxR family ATPase [unclassified Haloferax]|uniref:AAA family ATPase n=1 Tax=unclassified Haloferax TaxID=2625095 RepID=UPI0002B0481B|nr:MULTISPECIES: MoxR family ATPase [unclassified Haloferax]ELZ60211.1 methanol dehydrogenase regulatory protein [Haloferax sp. ATCC BAA-646]ELZ64423.1 methanol dehydrogenase regulatory protein [Haloferax sp. ATCC BAA-645]ELZ69742.1 methanol dehydrogenase regulatory protein [Haloferax sp. ATCC BAA-644]